MYTEEELKDRSFTKARLVETVLDLQSKSDKAYTEEEAKKIVQEGITEIAEALGEDLTSLHAKVTDESGTRFRLVEVTDQAEFPPAHAAWLDTVVIPYKASMAAGNELTYAIRSWAKNYPDLDRIVIIGDDPGITCSLEDKLIWISCPTVSENPQIDVANKMMAAIAAPEVPEEFIWSNDDIYLTNEVSHYDLRLPVANGELVVAGNRRQYNLNRQRTIAALKAQKFTRHDYATHTPKVFEKTLLANIIGHFNCEKEGHLISSLYFNVTDKRVPFIIDNGKEGRGSFVASVYKKQVTIKKLTSAAAVRLFINHNDAGWPVCSKYLEQKFPSPSIFEC